MHKIHTLGNGLKVIINQVQTAGVYCGIALDCGTRDELDCESGMAHFTEHMSFKGTSHRSAMQIINYIEGVGGELNAYTGKEETVYYCAVQPPFISRAVNLLFDIVFNSTYPKQEMKRECEVVIDEIESYNDSPADLIFDDFEHLLYADHPLGRNILGKSEQLRTHTTEMMHTFTQRSYRPDKAVFFIAGPVDEHKVLRLLEKQVRNISTTPLTDNTSVLLRQSPGEYTPTSQRFKKQVHQAHCMLGTRTVSITHPDRLTVVLLNNILGGPGLNSRFNLALRERNGLVYTVESNYTGYTDAGIWSLYFGCDQKDVKRCTRLALCEMDKLMQKPLSNRAMNAAIDQMCGQLALSYDHHESVAIGMGKTMLHYGHYLSMPEIIERLHAITPQKLQDVAQRTLSPTNLSTLIYE